MATKPRRRPQILIAIALSAIALVVFRAYVSLQFVPIRIEILTSESYPTRHVVAVALPDVSTIRGQHAVLTMRLSNLRAEQRRIGLLGDAFPSTRIVLPPSERLAWNVLLSPDQLAAVAGVAGGATRSLELIGDADGWALTALEIRNYRWRLGEQSLAVSVPRAADVVSGTGFLPVAIALFLLSFAQAFGPRLERRSLRLASDGVSLAAAFACLACLILPWTSPYKVLLSPVGFALLVAALFAPVIVSALLAFPRMTARATAFWTRHPMTCERGAALFALVAIGVAQPIFDVVSNSPEFFTARGTVPATAVVAVFAICLGLPILLLGIERAIRVITQRGATTFHAVLFALLVAAIAMPALRRSGIASSPADALAAAAVGLTAALANARLRIVRQFLTALSPAAIVVPALFLADPAVLNTFVSPESPTAAQTIQRTPPIVLVVFDEFPLNSLLDGDENIDAERYPHFAALARDGYWFRNASTVSSATVWAVPAILSGRYPTTPNAVPTLRYYPVNLFTTLARTYEIFASLRFQALCPPQACERNSAMPDDTVRSLLADLSLVWLHIAGPQVLTDTLPTVAGDWANFGEPSEEQTGRIRGGRAGVFAQFLSSINGEPARLYVLHLMLPHMAFQYVPSGHSYRAPDYQTTTEGGQLLFERAGAAYANTLYQRHLAQVGFVDHLIGDLIARLREVGAYDEALVVVTADHGASYREGTPRRSERESNLADIIQVPLFIKLPGQRQGGVVDRIVETVDILPTILDVVGAGTGLRLDGRSLIDASVPDRSQRTFVRRDQMNATLQTFGEWPASRGDSLERKLHRFGSGNFSSMYAPPESRDLLGMDARRLTPRADVQIAIRDQQRFASVALNRNSLPLYVRGVLTTPRPDPLSVAVAVNGVVVAVTQSYRERRAHVFGTLIPESSLREGNNTVAAFVVEALPSPKLPN